MITYNFSEDVIKKLLKDQTTSENIIWTTDNKPITLEETENIMPRSQKDTQEKKHRTLHKAEVFTQIWIVNKQNNLIDEAWFGYKNPFNTEKEPETWKTRKEKIKFPKEKTWKDYVNNTRMEMSCGEAPYITSQYDPVDGEIIPFYERVGILDRKLRVVDENTTKEEDYIEWSLKALKNTYAFEYQGDNLLIARKNILKTYIDSYKEKMEKEPSKKTMDKAIEIITWNTWQMDLTTCTIPNTCKDKIIKKRTLFETEITTKPCPGCQKEDIKKHTGIYAKIYDWEKDEEILFLDLIKFKRKRR